MSVRPLSSPAAVVRCAAIIVLCLTLPCKAGPQQTLKRALEAKDGATKRRYAEQLMEEAPSSWQPYAVRAEAFLMLGELEKAKQDADEAIQRAEDEAVNWAIRSRVQLLRREFDGAVSDADEAIRLGYQGPLIYGIRAEAHQLKNDYAAAEADANHALERDAQYVPALVTRAKARQALGQGEQSLQDLDDAIRIQADNLVALTQRIDLLVSLQRFDEAVRDCKTWAGLQPESDKPDQVRREILQMQAAKNKDLKPLQALTAEEPQNIQHWLSLAKSAKEQRQWADVAAAANRVLSLQPDNQQAATAYLLRGVAHRVTGDLAQALDDLTKAHEHDPNLDSVLAERGAVLFLLKRYEAAIEELDEVLARADCSDRYFARLWRTKAYVQLEDWDRAYNDARQLVRDATSDEKKALAYFELGVAAAYKRLLDESVEANTQAIRIDPKSASAYFNRASGNWQRGQHQKALTDCEDGLQIEPDSVFGRYLRGAFYSLACDDPVFCRNLTGVTSDAARAKAKGDLQAAAGADSDGEWRAWCYARLAELARNQELHDEAIQMATRALSAGPNKAHSLAYVVRAASRRARKEYLAAIEDCTQATQLGNEWFQALAYAERSAAHRALEKYEQAISDADEALLRRPNQHLARHERGYAKLAQYRGAGVQPGDGAAAKLAAILLDPTGGVMAPRFWLGDAVKPASTSATPGKDVPAGTSWPYVPEPVPESVHEETERHPLAAAVADFRILVAAGYNRTSSVCGLAHCLYEMGRFDEARCVCDQALSSAASTADRADLYAARAMVLFSLGQIEAGRQDARAAVSDDPNDPDARWVLACGHALAANWRDCRAECEQGVRLRPPAPTTSRLLLLWYVAQADGTSLTAIPDKLNGILTKLAIPENVWPSPILFSLVRGQQAADSARQLPENLDARIRQRRLCQTAYYHAVNDLAAGRISFAKRALQQVLELGAEQEVEFLLAQQTLQQLGNW